MTDNLDILARRARRLTDRAFADLARHSARRIHRLAWRIVGDADLASDVVQDVLIKLFRVLPSYRPERPFAPWLDRITVRAAIDRRRSERIDRRVDLSYLECHKIPDSEKPDRQLEDLDALDELNRLCRGLSESQRRVFVLRDLEEWTTAEIARELEIAESTVRVHLARARKGIRDAWLAKKNSGGK